MRVFCSVYARGLRRYSTYRAATLAAVLTNSVFGAINAMVLLALFAVRPEINGYDASDAITQVFIGQALIGVSLIIHVSPSLELSERVRSGDVGTDLLRPVPLLVWWLAQDLGRSTFALLSRAIPTFTVGVLFFDITLPGDALRPLAVLTSFVLVALIAFGLRYLYSLAGFWLVDTRGLWILAGFFAPIAAGMTLPLPLFPPVLADVLRLLPWASLVQIPTEIYLGKHTLPGGSLLGGLALQAGWAVALLLLCAWLTTRATRKVVVQGG